MHADVKIKLYWYIDMEKKHSGPDPKCNKVRKQKLTHRWTDKQQWLNKTKIKQKEQELSVIVTKTYMKDWISEINAQ